MINSDEFVKSSLHTISPYIGKVRPELAHYLISTFCDESSDLLDPFCGSGTIPFEGWMSGKNVFGFDMSIYAYCISLGKLNPPLSLEECLTKIDDYQLLYQKSADNLVNIRNSNWARTFFHPQTYMEICWWTDVLLKRQEWFILSNLLGILHHQRPSFLSFPCSNGAPYLRDKKFPIDQYPEMYEYKNAGDFLRRKVIRCCESLPNVNYRLIRGVKLKDCRHITEWANAKIDIVTSPPYMQSLSYGRDNRLRLFFLGEDDHSGLDREVSPSKGRFRQLMIECFQAWRLAQSAGSKCVLILGDIIFDRKSNQTLPEFICKTGEENGYRLIQIIDDPIKEARKVIKGTQKIKSEKICILERK